MQNLRMSATLIALQLCLITNAQKANTTIEARLDVNEKGRIAVNVYPPAEKNDWRFVVPEIIPGTYMKINYERFYDKILAVDIDGDRMKVKKKDNVYLISGDKPLDHLSYSVEQSFGDGRIWDNILTCAGTIFTEDGYLINAQLISGYFDGYENEPHQIEFVKPKEFYGITSMNATMRSGEKDVFLADNYADLIDQPILYNEPDTSWFEIKDNKFCVAVHSETGKVTSDMLKPRLEKIMHAIDSFSGFTTPEDYYFVFYYVNKDRLKGMFKTFGMGSALEHKESSFYYFNEHVWDTTFTNLDWIAAHEYFHTITPLNLHSEKIHDFNFEESDMSRHGWMYEGITDYFAALLSAQYDLSNSFSWNMQWAVTTAEKQKGRSFTESSQNIIKKNMFSWLGKIGQLGNFYERGKLVAFAMDVEIYEQSAGEKRLIDVMLEMKKDFDGSYFPDDQLKGLLVKYSYPKVGEIYEKYVEGEEVIPYDYYFEKLGWKYHPKGSMLPSYGDVGIRYSTESDKYYIKSKSSLALQKGDALISVNGIEANLNNARNTKFLTSIYYPEAEDEVTIVANRNGEIVEIVNKPTLEKLKYPRIKVQSTFSEEQKAFRKGFYKQE